MRFAIVSSVIAAITRIERPRRTSASATERKMPERKAG
jgi:hypothetical protein